MPFALFLGCKIPYFLPHYETATRRVAAHLGLELKDMEFNCCGYPQRHLYFPAYILSAARNLALAEVQGLDIVTPCKCCFGSLKAAAFLLEENASLRDMVAAKLSEEGLSYKGGGQVRHLLQVLDQEVGAAGLKDKVVRPFKDLKIALMYGCHALRPSQMTQFDDPLQPSLFDRLVELTGCESLDWDGKLGCCGGPLRDRNPDLSRAMILKRLEESKASGAEFICLACTYCQIQAEEALAQAQDSPGPAGGALLYPQLLGLSLGLPPEELGLNGNHGLNLEHLLGFFAPEEAAEAEEAEKTE